MGFSQRILRLQQSGTRAVAEKASALRAKGMEIISFSLGEPDFASPRAAFDAAAEAMARGETKYSDTAGIADLRGEVAAYYKQRFGLDYGTDQVIVGAGAKPLLFEVFGVLLDPGDEAIVNVPAYVSYVEQIRFFDATPVLVDTVPGTLDLDIPAIRAAITERTRVIVLNSPNNPTGRIFSEESVAELCRLAVEHDLAVVNDEVYERIAFDGHSYRNPLCYVPEAYDHMININAASKTYAMTGWRIGYAVGPKAVIKKMSKLQGHVTSGACSIAQWASVGALVGAQQDVESMVAEYQRRKDVVLGLLADMPLIDYAPPEGAFYVFIDIRGTYGKSVEGSVISDDIGFCEAVLEHCQVALIPGTAFLQPGYVRLSFATSIDNIRTGLGRIATFLEGLRRTA